jgi:threonine/homoserine/homoserine lactone efflux protein
MLGTHHLLLFLASGILLNITPGQDTLYILGRTLSQGRRAGVLSALGISVGSMVHTLAAALGLSAILASSASAFLVLKLAGAAYLICLGFGLWRSPPAAADRPQTMSRASSWAIFRAGMLTNVLNPKVALFFLAFLPQFVDPAAPSKVVPFLFLGSLFITSGTLWCLFLAVAASAVSRRLRRESSLAAIVRRVAGTVLMALGVRLAVSSR